jgi:hypothetical protein
MGCAQQFFGIRANPFFKAAGKIILTIISATAQFDIAIALFEGTVPSGGCSAYSHKIVCSFCVGFNDYWGMNRTPPL